MQIERITWDVFFENLIQKARTKAVFNRIVTCIYIYLHIGPLGHQTKSPSSVKLIDKFPVKTRGFP